VAFEFDGGTNFDPARHGHSHNGCLEVIDTGRIRARWFGGDGRAPSPPAPVFRLQRKKT
jgi:hypothetical protein